VEQVTRLRACQLRAKWHGGTRRAPAEKLLLVRIVQIKIGWCGQKKKADEGQSIPVKQYR
jgi:hypothetical protein